MNYRIVPRQNSDGKVEYWPEYQFGLLNKWHAMKGNVMGLFSHYYGDLRFNSIEEARQEIENDKKETKRWAEKYKAKKRFEKENPPIYV